MASKKKAAGKPRGRRPVKNKRDKQLRLSLTDDEMSPVEAVADEEDRPVAVAARLYLMDAIRNRK